MKGWGPPKIGVEPNRDVQWLLITVNFLPLNLNTASSGSRVPSKALGLLTPALANTSGVSDWKEISLTRPGLYRYALRMLLPGAPPETPSAGATSKNS